MKPILAIALVVLVAGQTFAGERPSISIEKAIAIARQSLEERNLDKTLYIESVKYELSSLVRGHRYWMVTWSGKIPADTPKKKEVGMKIYMDGRATRLVE